MSTPVALPTRTRVNFWHGVLLLDELVRLHSLAFVLPLLLIAARAAGAALDPQQTLLLLAIGFCFNAFGNMLNDVIDLEVDRREPQRVESPLVRGELAPRTALRLALVQLPVAGLLARMAGADRYTLVLLGGAFGLMAVYDLFGKRSPVPPATDLAQGLAGGLLVLFAGRLSGGSFDLAIVAPAAYCVCFIPVATLHGGLRDLTNDRACEARTSAIYLGAVDTGAPTPSRHLVAYSVALHAGLFAAIWTLLVHNPLRYSQTVMSQLVAVELLLGVAMIVLMLYLYRVRGPAWELLLRVHVLGAFLPLVVAFAPAFRPGGRLALATVLVLPLLVLLGHRCVSLTAFQRTVRCKSDRALAARTLPVATGAWPPPRGGRGDVRRGETDE
jgi:4-hydroxybenzoate polyprenyltransferase